MNHNTGLINLVGQNKAQPRVPGSCFVLSEAPRPLGTNCASQRVLLPGGLSWSRLDYNSQLLFQKHLFFVCFNLFHTHACARTRTHIQKPGSAFLRGLECPGISFFFHALASEGFSSRGVFIYGLDWQSAPYKCSGFSSIELGALTLRSWSCRARGTSPSDVLSPELKAKNMFKVFGDWSSNL